jgi:hypothetical protein
MSDPRAVLFTRRDLLSVTAAEASAAMLPPAVYASDFHRFTHGAFDITVVSDGFITLPAEILLPDATPEERPRRARAGQHSTHPSRQRPHSDRQRLRVEFPVHGRKARGQPQRLGRGPREDHEGRLHPCPSRSLGRDDPSDGKVLYPNAHYFVSRAEWDFWTDKNFEAKMPQVLHGFAQGAQRDLFAVRDRLTFVKPGEEIVPGMLVVDTPGHTPGHISIELAGDGNLLVTGDACTNDVIFFEHPSWHFGFDTDEETALRSRQMLLDRAASEKLRMLGYHWAYPGIGYAERRGSGYAFVKA